MRTVNSEARGLQLRAETTNNSDGNKLKMVSLKKVVVNLKELVPEFKHEVKVEINAKINQHFNLLLDGIMKALEKDFTKCP
jgi:hypothetical protein